MYLSPHRVPYLEPSDRIWALVDELKVDALPRVIALCLVDAARRLELGIEAPPTPRGARARRSHRETVR